VSGNRPVENQTFAVEPAAGRKLFQTGPSHRPFNQHANRMPPANVHAPIHVSTVRGRCLIGTQIATIP
jgi:hypothetical protein